MHNAHLNDQVTSLLGQERTLPVDPQQERVVMWKVFRDEASAVTYAHHILLEADQQLVGGQATDSIGKFYWLGVHVADLAAWGNTQAIQLNDPFDAEDPKGQGQGFGN